MLVQLGYFFAVLVLGGCAQERQQLLDVLDLGKYLGLHLRLALQFVWRRVCQLLDVIKGEDTRLALQRTAPPVLVHRLEDCDDVALFEL